MTLISRIQATSGVNLTGGTANIVSTAFSSSITANNTIVVGLSYDAATGSCSGMTDSNGNTYTKVKASSRRGCEIWVCYNVKGGASNVVTAVLSFVDGAIFAEEWRGLRTTGFDASGTTTANTVNPSVATGIPSFDYEMLFAVVLNDVNTTVYTAGAGFSNLVSGQSNFCYGASESKLITTATSGTQTGAFVGGTGGNSWDLAVASFKSANTSLVNRGLRPHPFSPGLAR